MPRLISGIAGIWRQLLREERGAALIEMALIAPVLATIVVGMIDLSSAYSAKLKLEQAAQRTIEKAEQTIVSATMMDALQAEGTSAAAESGFASSTVTVDYWLECSGTRVSNYDTTCSAGQSYARYLTVNIQSSYTPTISANFPGANPDGSFTINGKARIRTQ